jgi:hypothetical protein
LTAAVNRAQQEQVAADELLQIVEVSESAVHDVRTLYY